ncbi:GNAT family N-acetyltransferase [Cohnella suwonensis]|uniref:GNAT family N-acetyltransferase n=1 Tax=Cohnella suwonensis TaxID=696072 RepID=A0ABW0M271_9BACL
MSAFTNVLRAEPEHTQDVMRLLVNTAEWLLSKGSSQWNSLLRGEDSHNTPEAINRGEVYLFKEESKTAGMVMLLANPSPWDLELWEDRANDGAAVYVHRLAVNRKFSGKGVGNRMMKWVEQQTPELSRTVIRLDCIASNEVLNRFYSKLGYEHVGQASNENGLFSKYEKTLPAMRD